jgi:hypothetical protein
LQVRCPAWATGPLEFQLNGQPLAADAKPGEFTKIERTWNKGDRLKITIPMGLRVEALPGAPDKVAILYGPLVLAGDLGSVPRSAAYPFSGVHTANDRARTADVPTLVAENNAALLKGIQRLPDSGSAPVFQTVGLGKPKEVTLRPFKDMPYAYYNVYLNVVSAAGWTSQEAAMESADAQQRADAARIVDEVTMGEQQAEVDHGLSSERSQTGDLHERKWRDAQDGGVFAFRLKVLRDVPQTLLCIYWGDERGARVFKVLVDGQLLTTHTISLS